MRSVSICPEEQGNPYNIQFLSHEEHIEAHVICWQPTNWYYDPVTRKKIDFGDGPIIPCKVIELSNPVSLSCIQQHKSINTEKEDKSEEREKCSVDDRSDRSDVNQHGDNVLKATKPKGTDKPVSTGGFWEGVKRVVKNAGDFVAEHKEEIGLGALAILGTVAEIAINSNDDSDDEGIGVLMKALAIIRILHFQTIASYQILLVSPMKENIQIHTHRRKNTQSLDTASITILRTA